MVISIRTLGRLFETQMSAVMITRGISERYPSSETFFVFFAVKMCSAMKLSSLGSAQWPRKITGDDQVKFVTCYWNIQSSSGRTHRRDGQ